MNRKWLYSCLIAAPIFLFGSTVFAAEEGSDAPGGLESMRLAAQNEFLSLYVDDATTEIAVQLKESNAIWHSNPINAENDGIADGEAKTDLRSQLGIEYYANSDLPQSMNNYASSIQYKQFETEELENGLKVIYRFGKEELGRDSIPAVMSKERFEKLILSKAADEEKEYLAKQYKLQSLDNAKTEETRKNLLDEYINIEKTDLYALSRYFTDFEIPNVYALLQKYGYTEKDLEQDNREHGIATEKKEQAKFQISIEYLLDGDQLAVKVPVDEIQYSDSFPLYSIEVLKYFGAADQSQNGYMFVPDGSGALINLNNGKRNADALKLPVYGNDTAIQREEITYQSKQTALPVYGMKVGNDAFLAIMENGEAHANIIADISGKRNSYNYVYPQYIVRPKDQVTIDTGEGQKKLSVFQNEIFDGEIQIRYAFMNGENADYAGMANVYRQYLIEADVLKKKQSDGNVPFFLEVIGGIQKKKSIIGIPFKVLEPLTTYEQAGQILGKLQDFGVRNLTLKFSGWFNGGLNHTTPSKIRLERKLGGEKAFTKLAQYAENEKIGFFPDIALQSVYKNSLGFSPSRDAVRFLNKEVALIYGFNRASNLRDFTGSYRFLLSPLKLDGIVDRFVKHYQKWQIRTVFLRDLGSELYSDFKAKRQVDRQEAKNAAIAQFENLRKNGLNIGIQSSNSYAFAYADHILNVPTDSSRYFLEDEEVPFYQMVIRGYIDFAGEPVNMAADYKKSMLQTVETGGGLHYRWIFASNTGVKDTEHDDLLSVHYGDWMEQAAAFYERVNRDFGAVRGQTITDHRILADNVRRTYFEDGTSVIVNYNEQPVNIEGIAVKGLDYRVVKGDASNAF